jgi:integrase
MPKLPFTDFPGSGHYIVKRDVLTVRYRLPHEDAFHCKATRFRESRGEKRAFFEWARQFLLSGGRVPDDWTPTHELDAKELAKLDETTTLGEAKRAYLEACVSGNSWMKPREDETLETVTRPVLGKFAARFGEATPLVAITSTQIHAFVRDLGGKKETKERHLCPIANMFTWAIREQLYKRANPAHGIVFWREKGEEPHDGVRKSYTDAQFERLLTSAVTDPLALDAIYLCRYLALRPQDAVMLRWEDWHWTELLVAVRRIKTRESGVEVSHVDLHPTLLDRFRHRRGATGYCLEYAGKRTKVVWPSGEELAARVGATSASAVARELGVTEAAVRKRLNRRSARARVTEKDVSEEVERRLLADSISQRVSRITEAAGLYEEGIQPTYVLRHTFASDNLRRGVPPAVVAKEMGISILTLEKYYFHLIPRGELDDRQSNRWGLARADIDNARSGRTSRAASRDQRRGASRPDRADGGRDRGGRERNGTSASTPSVRRSGS